MTGPTTAIGDNGPMIGVFDSGVGGLGVLAEIRRLLPDADLVYVADRAGVPYGEKTLRQVRARTEIVTLRLLEMGADLVVVACNTASAAALHHLRALHPATAFVGMEPAVKPAVALSRRRRVGVLATAATFQGRLFASVVERFAAGIEVVTAACPSWVRLVEAGELTGEKARAEVEAGLRPLLAAEVDVVVLACTHFPFLLPTIREVAGSGVVVYDPAPAVARQVARLAGPTPGGGGRLRLLSTAPGADLAEVAARLGIAGPLTVLPWGRDASS